MNFGSNSPNRVLQKSRPSFNLMSKLNFLNSSPDTAREESKFDQGLGSRPQFLTEKKAPCMGIFPFSPDRKGELEVISENERLEILQQTKMPCTEHKRDNQFLSPIRKVPLRLGKQSVMSDNKSEGLAKRTAFKNKIRGTLSIM